MAVQQDISLAKNEEKVDPKLAAELLDTATTTKATKKNATVANRRTLQAKI